MIHHTPMRRIQTALEPLVGDRIWVCERPIKFSGAWLRTRTVVVRLDDGCLWIHSPPEPTDELCAALDQLGPVRWLVAPNKFHHLQIPAFAQRYPGATVIGPASVCERNKELQLDADISDPAVTEQTPELLAMPLAEVPFLDETVFFHRPTRTLIGADLALCACAKDHWSWRLPARLFGCYNKVGVPPDVRFKTRATVETATALREILALPIEQISVAHADLITDSPAQQLERAWRFVLRKFPEEQAAASAS